MKTLIAIVLAVVSMNAMAGHDYQPNPRYDDVFKLTMSGVQWQTWSGNVGPNYEDSGVPAEFNEFIYLTLGGWRGTDTPLRCEYKVAAQMDPVASAKNRAVHPGDFVYNMFFQVDCYNEHARTLNQISAGTQAKRQFINRGEIKRGLKAVEVQAAWDGMKDRIFSDFSGSNCQRIHTTIDNWRSDNEIRQEWCY